MSIKNGFTFFRSYYDSLEDFDKDTRNEIINAILDFVFKDKKPKFTGIKRTIWTLIEPNLIASKNKSNKNSGAPVGNQNACKIKENSEENKTIKKQSKNNQKTISDLLSLSLSYSNSIINNNKIINKLFIEYINIRKDNDYIINETIIQRLLKKLEQASSDDERIEMIEQAINGKWKDFYPVESKKEKTGERRVF